MLFEKFLFFNQLNIILLFSFLLLNSNKEPQPLKTHKKGEVLLAHLIQRLFYILIFFMGCSGYFIATAKGKGIEFFTLFEVPAMTSEIEENRADMIGSAHEAMAFILAILVILHALAALKHHFYDKDETLRRMTFK